MTDMPGGDRGRARRRGALATVDLDEAHAARAERLERIGGTQLRDRRRRPGRRRASRTCPRRRATVWPSIVSSTVRLGAVRGGRDRVPEYRGRARHREAELIGAPRLEVVGEVHQRTAHGQGVKPPIAHSEPSVMTSHRSTSTSRLASRSMPAMILSISSTPRVEPMRHGVHLPHDSIAQNSIANRA